MTKASELMNKWIERENTLVYEIASIIKDDPDVAPILVEELVKRLSNQALDEVEDVIINDFGVEVYGEDTQFN